ncbi:MAG: hypothetical protein KDD11_16520 [Acidobacteria bacterium]|nr:hypothetical protein [Acidobacteriota bacterium]
MSRREAAGSHHDDADALARALRELGAEVRRRLEHHPWGHLLGGRRERLRVQLDLPVNPRPEDLRRAAEELDESVAEAVQGMLAHLAVVRPGHAYCLRCAAASCEHSVPPGPRHVFAAYGPTGVPRFTDLGQWLLELHDPRVDELYRDEPRLLTLTSTEPDLTGELLEAYRDPATGYRLHGQVAAGWFRLPDAQGDACPVAVSFQLVSSRGPDAAAGAGRGRKRRWRFALGVVGVGPGGESLDEVFARTGVLPWSDAVRWAQEALGTLEESADRRRSAAPRVLDERLQGIVGGLARRLERGRRAVSRRTRHGQQRHEEGDRPTAMTLADLRRAGRDDLLFDVRNETLVVLGERGRAHVFSPEGKLVTSVRYSPPAIERRRQSRRWRPATGSEVAGLEKRLGTASRYDLAPGPAEPAAPEPPSA